MQKKIVKKYAELMHQAQQATGRKEAVGLIHKAAKLKTKFDNYEMMWSSTKQFSQIRMSLLNKFSIKDIILSSKEAYQKELKNNGVGSQIGKSLFNKFSIKDIILSSKEAYQKELKNNGVGSQIGKSLFNKFSIKDFSFNISNR